MEILNRMTPRRAPRAGVLALAALLASACLPEFDENPSLVLAPRVLAVRAEPAEAAQNGRLQLQALVAGAGGPTSADVEFALCTARKPLSELGPVDPACLSGADVVQPLGTGAMVSATIDREACSRFGPRRPLPEPGQPAGRPVDPDPTGGYYQPVLAGLPGSVPVLSGVRLSCGLPGADREQTAEFNRRHRPNENPAVSSLEWSAAGTEWQALGTSSGGAAPTLSPGAELSLRVGWAPCPDSEAACTGSETYVYYDNEIRSVVDRTEELRASWYATAGEFDAHTTGPAEPTSTTAENRWRAPAEAGIVDVWLVLRDGRGGVGWESYRIQIQ